MRIFVLSDTHFGHRNIIKYANRPFASVEEMNNQLIENWNKTVANDDLVIFCGDLCMANYINHEKARDLTSSITSQLNGHKILVKGNHENKQVNYLKCGFEYQCDQLELPSHNILFIHDIGNLCEVWPHEFVFYGHFHNTKQMALGPYSRNISVEWINYTPFEITKWIKGSDREWLENLLEE